VTDALIAAVALLAACVQATAGLGFALILAPVLLIGSVLGLLVLRAPPRPALQVAVGSVVVAAVLWAALRVRPRHRLGAGGTGPARDRAARRRARPPRA
jgi:uncharacterized membrane protein YfcA